MSDTKKPLANHILVFFVFLVVTVLVLQWFTTWYIVGLILAAVIAFVAGYGAATIGGLICGGIIWFIGILSTIWAFITNPFHLVFAVPTALSITGPTVYMIDINYMLGQNEFWYLVIALLLIIVGGIIAKNSVIGWGLILGGLLVLVYCAYRFYTYTQRVGLSFIPGCCG